MSTQRGMNTSERAVGVARHRPLLAAAAAAGVLGPVLYAAAALVQSLLRADHNLMTDPIAKLAAGPDGWVQHANFVVLGSLFAAFAIGLHRGVLPARWGAVGAAFLVAGGLGQVWAGLVEPSRPPFVATFLGAGIGFVWISRRMSRDPQWRALAGYTLGTGCALIVALPLGVLLGIPPDSTPTPWSGLASWVLAGVWFAATPSGCAASRRHIHDGHHTPTAIRAMAIPTLVLPDLMRHMNDHVKREADGSSMHQICSRCRNLLGRVTHRALAARCRRDPDPVATPPRRMTKTATARSPVKGEGAVLDLAGQAGLHPVDGAARRWAAGPAAGANERSRER